MRHVLLLAAALALVTSCKPRAGHDDNDKHDVVVQVVASGRAETTPDEARISIGVESYGPTATAALDTASATMARVLGAVEAAGVAKTDIQTTTLANGRSYFNRSRSRFESSNSVTVLVRDVAKAGAVIAAASAAGANDVNGPSFALADPNAPVRAARMDALAQARRQADAYAAALGLRVLRVARINEGADLSSPVVADLAAPAPMMRAREAPPVRAGTETSSVVTHVDYILGPK